MNKLIMRQLTSDEVDKLIETNDYGYYCEWGVTNSQKELIIVWTSEFNEGNPCIIATNAMPKSKDGVFTNLPGESQPLNFREFFNGTV